MFRLWYLTFAGNPRDGHVHHHAHESPKMMTVPLMILAVLAVVSAWNVLDELRPGTALASRPSRRESPKASPAARFGRA